MQARNLVRPDGWGGYGVTAGHVSPAEPVALRGKGDWPVRKGLKSRNDAGMTKGLLMVGVRSVDQERKSMQTCSLSPADPAKRKTPKTGAQIIVDALLAHGVDTVFGYIGASVLPLFDELYESPIRVVVPAH